MARELGLGVVPYLPLGGGVLSGNYGREDVGATGAGPDGSTRRSHNLALGTLTERSFGVAAVVQEVAGELGHTPAQVALAWTMRKPGVTSTLLGARTPAQLENNLGALAVELTDSQLARLDAADAIALGQPHELLTSEPIRRVTTGDLRIETRR